MTIVREGSERRTPSSATGVARWCSDAFARFAAPSFGGSNEYIQRVLLPQIFTFVALLVVGSGAGHSALSVVLRLGIVGYLVGLGIVVRGLVEVVSFRLVVLSTAVVGGAVLTSTISLGLEPLTHLWLPILGLVAPLLPFRLPRDGALGLSAGIGGVVLIGATACPMNVWALSCMALLGAFAVAVVVRATVRGERPSPREGVAVGTETVVEVSARRELSDDSFPAEDLQILWHRTALSEFVHEALWRLSGATIIVGSAVGMALGEFDPRRFDLLVSWFLLAAVQLIVFGVIFRAGDVAAVVRATFLGAVVVAMWSLLLILETRAAGWLPHLIMVVVVGALGPLPWPQWSRGVLGWTFLVGGGLAAAVSSAPVLVGGVMVALVAAVVRLSAVRAVQLHTRTALHLLRRVGEGAPTSLTAVRALAWQFGRVVETPRVLLFVGERTTHIIEGMQIKPSTVDPIYARGIQHTIVGRGRDEGIVSFRELGAQYLAPMLDWFGRVPTGFFFVRLVAVVDGREEHLTIFLPLSLTARLAGRSRIERALGGVAALVRAWLVAARGRFLSSDAIQESQRSISAREEELNQLVHLVNNVAQDVSATCDGVRQALATPAPVQVVGERVEEIERLMRSLSAGVSDIKLLRELVRVRVLPRRDTVDVAALLEDLGAFARHHAHRAGRSCVVESSLEGVTGVMVASREYLGVVLRLLLRLVERCTPVGGTFSLVARADGVDGVALVVSTAEGSPERESEGKRAADVVAAAENLARLSEGTFTARSAGATQEFILTVPSATRAVREVRSFEGWALLVDDNPQVTTFYGRVAEAMRLRHYTAAAIAEAEALVATHGAPRIVVTDIQLGDGSGLKLVRSLRGQFGAALPIVVVSGATGVAVEAEVRSAGATTYLSKPVGRSKLFAEIQQLLRGASNEKQG